MQELGTGCGSRTVLESQMQLVSHRPGSLGLFSSEISLFMAQARLTCKPCIPSPSLKHRQQVFKSWTQARSWIFQLWPPYCTSAFAFLMSISF